MASPAPTGASANPTATPGSSFLPTSVSITILVLLSFPAFLISGFGSGLGSDTWQPVPIFAYLSLLLLVFQGVISEGQVAGWRIYIFATSAIALLYTGFEQFTHGPGANFLHDAHFYAIINVLLIFALVVNAVQRFIADQRQPLPAMPPTTPAADADARDRIRIIRAAGAIAADGTGLVVLIIIAQLALALLQSSGVVAADPAVLPLGPFNLGTWNNIVGAAGFVLLMLGLVVTGAQVVLPGAGSSDVRRYLGSVAQIILNSLNEVRRSLRGVLSPLIWLVPSFILTSIAQGLVNGFNTAARTGNLVDLSNSTSYTQAAIGILLVAASVLAVLIADSIIEFNGAVLQRMLNTLQLTARALALIVAPFSLALTGINKLVLLIDSNFTATPFRLAGGSTIFVGLFAIYVALQGLVGRKGNTNVPSPQPAS